jgi:adhesin/invasin
MKTFARLFAFAFALVSLIPTAFANEVSATLQVAPTQLRLSGPSEVRVDERAKFTITLTDADGNVEVADKGYAVVVDGPTGALFYPSAVGGSATQTFTVATGQQSVDFYMESTTLGEGEIVAVRSGFEDKRLTVTVVPGAVDVSKSVLSVSGVTSSTDDSVTVTLALFDVYNNALDRDTASVAFTTSLGGTTVTAGTYTSDGQYTAKLASTSIGATTVSANVTPSGGVLTAIPGAQDKTVTFSPGAADATQTTIAVSSSTMTTDGSVTVTVSAKDGFGNALTTGGDTVTLSSSLDGTAVGTVTDNNNGTYSASFTADSIGTATITGTIGGVSISGSTGVSVAVSAGAPSKFAISGPGTMEAGETKTITITAQDAAGNTATAYTGAQSITFGGATVSATGDNPTASATNFGTATSITFSAGVGTASIQLYNAESALITAADGTLNTGAGDELSVTVSHATTASTVTSTVTAGSVAIAADGESTSLITVQVKDAYGNAFDNGGDTVVINANQGTLLEATKDVGDGTYTRELRSTTTLSTANVTALLNGVLIGSDANVAFTPGPAAASKTTISAASTSFSVDNTLALTIQLVDKFGNNLDSDAGAPTLSTSIAEATITAPTYNGAGAYTATLSSTKADSVVITGTFGTDTLTDDERVLATPGSAIAAQSSISADSTSIIAGSGSTTVRVQLKDQYGNSLKTDGGTVALTTTSGTLGAVSFDAGGEHIATLTPTALIGSATITATVTPNAGPENGVLGNVPGSASVAFRAGAPAKLTISQEPSDIVIGEAITPAMTVRIEDANGNLTSSTASVTVATDTNPGDATLSGTASVSAVAGIATFNGISLNRVGTGNTLTFSSGTLTDATSSAFNSTAKTLTIGGTFTADDKSYDGAASATIGSNNLTLVGLVTGTDSVDISPVISFADGTLGAGKTVSIQNTSTLTGVHAANYTLDVTGAPTTTAEIKTKELSVAGSFTVNDRTYDATTDATIATNSLTLSGVVGAEVVTLDPPTAGFADKNVGTGKTVSLSGLTLSGADAGNYTVTATGAPTTTAAITAKSVTIGGAFTVSDKIYDGGVSATIATNTLNLNGTEAGDALTITPVAQFASKAVGTGINVSLATSTLAGADSSNYSIDFTGAPTSSAAISKRGLLITGAKGVDKAYDTNTTASVDFSAAALDSVVAGDVVTINSTGYSATFAAAAVADSVDITVTGVTLGGADAANYSLTQPAVKANITPGPVSVAANGSLLSRTDTGTTLRAGTDTASVAVEIKDQYGNSIKQAGVSVTFTSTIGTFVSATSTTDSTGVATAQFYSNAVGNASITATVDDDDNVSTAEVALTNGSPISIAVIPGPPSLFNISGTGTQTAGSSQTITVTVMDKFGNTVTAVSGPATLNFGGPSTSPSGDVPTINGSNFGTPTVLNFTAGVSKPSMTLYTAETANIYAISLPDTAATTRDTLSVVVASTVAAAAQSTVEVSPDTLVANGTATTLATVQLKDTYGNNLTSDLGDTVVMYTTEGTFSSVATAYDIDGKYNRTLIAGIEATTARVSATLNGTLLTDDATLTLIPDVVDADKSTVVASSAAMTTDDEITITVQLLDKNENKRDGTTDVVTLSADLDGVTLSAPVALGSGLYESKMTSTAIGTANISVVGEGVSLSSAPAISITPGAPSTATSTVILASTSITADDQVVATIQLKDAAGNNTLGTTDNVLVTSALTGSTVGATTNVGAGSYEATISVTTIGTGNVSATLDGNALAANSGLTVTPGAASPSQTSVIAASAAETVDNSVQITVQVRDQHGNNLAIDGDVVTVSTTGANTSLTAPAYAAAGAYTADLSSTVPGPTTVSATLNGTAVTSTVDVTFAAGAPAGATSQITASSATMSTDDDVTISVQLKDQYNNDATGTSDVVLLSSSLTGSSIGALTAQGAGLYTATLTSTAVGDAEIAGTVNGNAIVDGVTIAIAPGAPVASQSVLTVTANTFTTDETITARVDLKDAYGNQTSGTTDAVTISSSRIGTTVGDITAESAGSYVATISSSVIGTTDITATLSGDGVSNSETVTVNPGTAILANSTVSVSSTTLSTDDVVTVSVQLKDVDGNDMPNDTETVVISTSSDDATLTPVVSRGGGLYEAELSSTTVGDIIISATINGFDVDSTPTVSVVPGAPSLITSTVVSADASLVADGVSSTLITVQLKDAAGNNIVTGGEDVEIFITEGKLVAEVADNGDGTYTREILSPTETGIALVNVSINGDFMANRVMIDFTAGPIDPSTIEIGTSAEAFTTDETITVTVAAFDVFGNPSSNAGSIAITSTLDGSSATSVTETSTGNFTATFSATKAGMATLGAEVDGVASTSTANVTVNGGAVQLAQSTVERSMSAATTDDTVVITVRLNDAYGNPSSSTPEVAATTSLAGTSAGAATMVSAGVYEIPVTSVARGVTFVTATVDGTPLPKTWVSFTEGAASAATSTLTASAKFMTTYDTAELTVTLFDAAGLNLDQGEDLVVIESDLEGTTISDVVDNGDGSYTAQLTAEAGGIATITATVNGTKLDAEVTINIDDRTDAEELVITEFALHPSYPNPTRGQVNVSFDAPETSHVRIIVIDLLGRTVDVIADGVYESGRHTLPYGSGRLPAGSYIISMQSGERSFSRVFTKL